MAGKFSSTWLLSCPDIHEFRREVECGYQSQVIDSLRESAIAGNKEAVHQHLRNIDVKDLQNAKDAYGRLPNLLIYAVLGNAPECLCKLLEAGINIDEVDNNGRSALHWAAYKDSYQCLKLLLSHGANLRAKDVYDVTPLHMASCNPKSKCLQLILKYVSQLDVDAQDIDKRTALHWSACCGHLENIKMLLRNNANSGNPDAVGKTPIHWAASCRNVNAAECIKALLASAPLTINWSECEGRGPLHYAVADGLQSVIFEVISAPYCDVNAMDNLLRTPLHFAAYLGLSTVVKLLLDNGASTTNGDVHEARPLHYAALSSSVETIKELISRSIDIDPRDSKGCTPLMWAAGLSITSGMQLLIKHGADIRAASQLGFTALHLAAEAGHRATVALLIENGALIDVQDGHGRTALSHACEMGHKNVLQELLHSEASIHLADKTGKNVLHWAAVAGQQQICKMLACPQLNDKEDILGRTPLFYVAIGGFSECLPIFMELNSNLQHFDIEGYTPLHWACKKGNLDVVKGLTKNCSKVNCLSKNSARCTPLDLALWGDHDDVVYYLLNNGGVSIVDIKNHAATKIQAAYRGFSIRNELKKTSSMTRYDMPIISLESSASCCNNFNKKLQASSMAMQENILGTSESVMMASSEQMFVCQMQLSTDDSIFISEVEPPITPGMNSNSNISTSSTATSETGLSLSALNISEHANVDPVDNKEFAHIEHSENSVKPILRNRKKFPSFSRSPQAKVKNNTPKLKYLSKFRKYRESNAGKDFAGSSISLFSPSRISHVNKDYLKHGQFQKSMMHLNDPQTPTNILPRHFHIPPTSNVLHKNKDLVAPKAGMSASMDHLNVLCSRCETSRYMTTNDQIQNLESPPWYRHSSITKVAGDEWISSLLGVHVKKVRAEKHHLLDDN